MKATTAIKNNFRPIALLFLCTVVLLFQQPAFAETVYRWIDDKGVPHFGLNPPKNYPYETVQTGVTNTISGSTSTTREKKEIENTAAEGGDEATGEYRDKLDLMQKQQNESCQRAKNNKQNLLNNQRVRIQMADGSYKVLSYEEKLQQLKATDIAIQEYCSE